MGDSGSQYTVQDKFSEVVGRNSVEKSEIKSPNTSEKVPIQEIEIKKDTADEEPIKVEPPVSIRPAE